MSWIEIFDPGQRYWREEKERQETNMHIAPAPGPGPDDMSIDLDKMTATVRKGSPETDGADPGHPGPGAN
jgi:hypothetical protein